MKKSFALSLVIGLFILSAHNSSADDDKSAARKIAGFLLMEKHDVIRLTSNQKSINFYVDSNCSGVLSKESLVKFAEEEIVKAGLTPVHEVGLFKVTLGIDLMCIEVDSTVVVTHSLFFGIWNNSYFIQLGNSRPEVGTVGKYALDSVLVSLKRSINDRLFFYKVNQIPRPPLLKLGE